MINELIDSKGWIVIDGATGSNFFSKGLESGYPPDLWCIERPKEVLDLHNRFLKAGSDVILTNSFGANQLRLKLHNSQNRVREINVAAAELAREAVDKNGSGVVAGSVGPTGEFFGVNGTLTHQIAVEVFSEQMDALASGGIDVVWIETMYCVEEVKCAIEAANKTGLSVYATMTFDTAKRTMMGITPQQYVEFGERIGVHGIGSNCGVGPPELLQSIIDMKNTGTDLPIIAKGNCGIPQYRDGKIHWEGDLTSMAHYGLFARDAGASIIGGCCGTTPDHIQAMVEALNTTPVRQLDNDNMVSVLGEPWPNLPQTKQRKRRRKLHND